MYIYIISNTINDKKYIGQTVTTIEKRFKKHCGGHSKNMIIGKAIKKHGKDNFSIEILKECDSIEELNDMESYYIKLYNSITPNGYNIRSGGDNSTQNDETKKKISIALSGIKKSKSHIENVKNSNLETDPDCYKNLHKFRKLESYTSTQRKNLSRSKKSKSSYVGVTVDRQSYRCEFYLKGNRICKSFIDEISAAHYYDHLSVLNGMSPVNFPYDIWDESCFESLRSLPKKRLSKFYGVKVTNSGKWRASFWFTEPTYIGTFETEEEAAVAVDNFLLSRGLPAKNSIN